MGRYDLRVQRAAARLLQPELRNDDGGWGDAVGAPSSIVNTAEALRILRAAGMPQTSTEVTGAIEFLGEAIRAHVQPPSGRGRGEWTRYVVCGLAGLSLYTPRTETANAAISFGEDWLRQRVTNDGWGARGSDDDVSIYWTARATDALHRMRLAPDLVYNARELLLDLRVPGLPAWPNSALGSDVNASKTATCVLALLPGHPTHQSAATEGAAWLMENRSAWECQHSADAAMAGVRWEHMDFSLGLQACLAAEISILDPRLSASLIYVDQLWDDTQHLWREGNTSSERASVVSSAAVVACYEMMSSSLGRLDPTEVLDAVGALAPARNDEMQLMNRPYVQYRNQEAPPRIIKLTNRMWDIVASIIRHSANDDELTVSRDSVVEDYRTGIDTVNRQIRRLNKEVFLRVGVRDFVLARGAYYQLNVRRAGEMAGGETHVTIDAMLPEPGINSESMGDVRHYQFETLPPGEVAHGVFGRDGGVSEDAFRSLNVSLAVGDYPDRVRRNRSLVNAALSVDGYKVIVPRLVHGTRVLVDRAGVTDASALENAEADAVISNTPGTVFMMAPADCAVVLLYDPDNRAIGMAHAGWKGIVGRIGPGTIDALEQEFGSKRSALRVGIAPSVGPCHYRLGSPAQREIPGWAPYLEDLEDGLTAIDLPGMLIDQLFESGIESDNLIVDRRCTACNVESFFSYWIDKPTTGRMAVVLGLRS